MAPNKNLLLADTVLPEFAAINAKDVVPAIASLIESNKSSLDTLLANLEKPDWASLIAPFEENEDRLAKAFSPVSHLNAVMNSEDLREAYNDSIAKLTEYHAELGQNQNLFNAYQAIANSPEFSKLSAAKQKAIHNALLDFTLAGVDLPEVSQQRFKTIKQKLSELTTRFANNVMDATQGWHLQVTDENQLAGIPDTAIAAAKQAAETKQLEGWVFTLDAPPYIAVLTHADHAELREAMYRAYVSRASAFGVALDQSRIAEWDNTPLIAEILALRHEMASLLGFKNYAELSLAKKMAKNTDEVVTFLSDLAKKAKPAAEDEVATLKKFAKQNYGVEVLNPWDIAYYSEKQRQQVYSVSQEELRPYFPCDKVIQGLFAVASRLFQIEFDQDTRVNTWHPDAAFYWVKRQGKTIAGFYFDLYARENKRGGAWMDECRTRRQSAQGLQLPVAYLTCNFSAPTKDKPSLLTHTEVTTLFHEFGHGLHHMLTQIDVSAVSGINGVAWDAVELPSQFLENWCWEKSVIPLISGHYKTGEPLPEALLDKLLRAKNYQSAMQTVRQLEFALFDFKLHMNYQPENPQDSQQILDEVRAQVAVMEPPEYNKFQNGFTHIFAGGYAAGYYSYKWAEVLSADAFSLFEENGVFDKETADSFLRNILELGGSKDAMDLFVAFRGRKPQVEALLRHNGIAQ